MKKLFFVATMLTICLFSTDIKSHIKAPNPNYFYKSFNVGGIYGYSFQGFLPGNYTDFIISMNLQDYGLWPTDFKLSDINGAEAPFTMYRIHDSPTSCQLQGSVFLNGYWHNVVYHRTEFPLSGGGVGWQINVSVARLL